MKTATMIHVWIRQRPYQAVWLDGRWRLFAGNAALPIKQAWDRLDQVRQFISEANRRKGKLPKRSKP